MVLAVSSDLNGSDVPKDGKTLIEYMGRVRSRKAEAKIEDVIVESALDLLEKYDAFLKNVIAGTEINNAELIECLSLVRWRNIFYNSTNVTIPKPNSLEFQEMLTNIHIHYKWFRKYGMVRLAQLLRLDLDGSLRHLVAKIDDVLVHEFSALRKIAKAYQKLINPPPPLINDVQLAVLPAFNNMTSKIDMYSKCCGIETVLATTKVLRSDLIGLHVQLDFDFAELPAAFGDFQKTLDRASSDPGGVGVFETRLLPLEDYFVRLEVLRLRNRLDAVEDGRGLLARAQTVPCSLAGSLLRYARTRDSRLEHEISTEVYYYLGNCAVRFPGKFLGFKSKREEGGSLVALSHFSPCLSYIVAELLTMEETNKAALFTCLGDYAGRIKQLRVMDALLWRNMMQLSLPENDYMLVMGNYFSGWFL